MPPIAYATMPPVAEGNEQQVTISGVTVESSSVGSVKWTLPAVLAAARWDGVAIDSREVQPGDLFVALPGERVDGHRFVGDALRRGAAAALVRKTWLAQEGTTLPEQVNVVHDLDAGQLLSPTLIAVDDPLLTLQALAAHHRARFDLPVIGITGSIGKTSTKELLAAVLGGRMKTLANIKSFNNEIGLPLTLLRLRPEHEAVVLEMGIYGPGDLTFLCSIARPQIGIELNVGVSHLERMLTVETVARAKAELVQVLPADGVAILNGDDPLVRAMAAQTPAKAVFFGLGHNNDIRAEAIESRGLDGLAFTLHGDGATHRIETPLTGRHNVYTALATATAAHALGLTWDEIAVGLRTVRAQPRLSVRKAMNGATILDDTYNASPASCEAALDLLNEMPGRRVAVFGDMAELGPEEIPGHRAVGEAATMTCNLLVVVGGKARHIGEAALQRRPDLPVFFTATNVEASDLLRERLQPGDYVLVKGARVAATEEIVQALVVEEQG